MMKYKEFQSQQGAGRPFTNIGVKPSLVHSLILTLRSDCSPVEYIIDTRVMGTFVCHRRAKWNQTVPLESANDPLDVLATIISPMHIVYLNPKRSMQNLYRRPVVRVVDNHHPQMLHKTANNLRRLLTLNLPSLSVAA
jgi:hypothetical protein